jgi:hypothetical protein
MRTGALLICVGLAGVLAGCAVVDGAVAPRYDTLSRNFAEARNQSILLNIVRAAHDYPLSFSAISQALPQLTNSTTLALPSFLEGPRFCPTLTTCTLGGSSPQRDIVFGSSNLSNQTSIQTQFTLSTQETKDFYNGLLRPVDLYILNYFIRQGYSRELLFWLFADSVDIRTGNKTLGYSYNPPYSYGCPASGPHRYCFRYWAEIATISGLAVDQETIKDKEEKKDKVLSRLCFNEVLGTEGRNAMARVEPQRLAQLHVSPLLLSPRCGSPWPALKADRVVTDSLAFKVANQEFRIRPRSAYGIYEFLGKLLKQSLAEDAAPPSDTPFEPELAPRLSTVLDDQSVLNIVRNPTTGCFVRVDFIDGVYCVPEQGSENTKRIFGLLAQLTALQTTASDLAITPVVHAVQ